MADPTLTQFNASLAYKSDDQYSQSWELKSNARYAVKPADPKAALLEAARELARIGALFGYEAEVRSQMEEAFKAVSNWRAGR